MAMRLMRSGLETGTAIPQNAARYIRLWREYSLNPWYAALIIDFEI